MLFKMIQIALVMIFKWFEIKKKKKTFFLSFLASGAQFPLPLQLSGPLGYLAQQAAMARPDPSHREAPHLPSLSATRPHFSCC
jgi:hypothetical protein